MRRCREPRTIRNGASILTREAANVEKSPLVAEWCCVYDEAHQLRHLTLVHLALGHVSIHTIHDDQIERRHYYRILPQMALRPKTAPRK